MLSGFGGREEVSGNLAFLIPLSVLPFPESELQTSKPELFLLKNTAEKTCVVIDL